MQTGRRVFFTSLGFVIALAGLFFILVTLGLFRGIGLMGRNLDALIGDFNYILLGFLLFLLGLFFVVIFASRKGKEKDFGSIANFTELGEVRISLKAVESMVHTAARSIKGIREVSTKTDSTEQGLVIYLRVKTIPDVPIPGLASELQEKVKQYVQQISGHNVAEVKVLVENIAHEKAQQNLR